MTEEPGPSGPVRAGDPGPSGPVRAGDTGPSGPVRAGDTGPSGPVRAGGTDANGAGYETAAAAEPEEAPPANVPQTLKTLGSVIGPTTLVTALLFYFGWVRTRTQAADLGLEISQIDTSTQTTLLRSLSSLFLPLGALVLVAVLWLLAHWALFAWVRSPAGEGPSGEATRRWRAAWVRRIALAVIGFGVPLFALGLYGEFSGESRPSLFPYGPVCLGLGVGLTAYGLHVWRRLGTGTERYWSGAGHLSWIPTMLATLVVLLVAFSLLWTVSDYAVAIGHRQHRTLIGNLTFRPDVIVYSQRPLHLDSEGIEGTTLGEDPEGYRFQYTGLKLLFLDKGKYFLLPATWTAGESSVITLPDESWLRFEFVRGFTD